MTVHPPAQTEVLRYAAFSEVPGGGNPAGVVLDARALDDLAMLAIAADLGYSESAFAVPVDVAQRHYGVRYFSPMAEVPFCGHATVATAVALAERHGADFAGAPGPSVGAVTFRFDTPVGEVVIDTVRRGDGRIAATFTSVPTATRPATADELRGTLDALHWAQDDLDARYPPHIANAGNDHPVIAAATRERLADLAYDYDRLAALMAEAGWTTVHLFWAESPTAFHARNPFPPGGQVEDAATGAAAAAFAGYLRDLGLVEVPGTIVIHQGVDMGRPSLLTVEVTDADRSVRVTGTAVAIDD